MFIQLNKYVYGIKLFNMSIVCGCKKNMENKTATKTLTFKIPESLFAICNAGLKVTGNKYSENG